VHGFSFDFGDEAGGRAGMEADILSELFGGRVGGARARASGKGEDVVASVNVPLGMAVGGGSVRVALPTGKTLDIAIPAGVEDGKSIRLRGQGLPGGRGGTPGDAIVTVRYAPHPLFKVEGRDLRLDLPITLYEAVLGAKVRAPTLGGEVEMSIPPGASSGMVLRLRGKGLPGAGEAAHGDLLATLRIVVPPGEDADLAALMRRWRDEKPYDPRAGLSA
jgi:DnaJ-class molecular chaperone